jgi:hypothetical protein
VAYGSSEIVIKDRFYDVYFLGIAKISLQLLDRSATNQYICSPVKVPSVAGVTERAYRWTVFCDKENC